MTKHVDFLVIGGGLVGAATAWQLTKRGATVELLEQYEAGHSNGASYGTSRIFRHTYVEPEYLDLVQEAYAGWLELEQESGTRILDITGGISAGHDRIEAFYGALSARGLPVKISDDSPSFDGLSPFGFGGPVLVEERAGRVHADRAIEAFAAGVSARGQRVQYGVEVLALTELESHVSVHTNKGNFTAGAVVVAAGAWSRGFFADRAHLFTGASDIRQALGTLVVTQEQPAHFELKPEYRKIAHKIPSFTHQPPLDQVGPGRRWPSGVYGLFGPEEGQHGRVKVGFHGVGPVTQPETRTFTPEGAQVEQLKDYVRTFLPALDPDSAEVLTCTYTTTPDHNFVLDRRGRVVVGAGFSGHGFKFGPALGRVLADLAQEALHTPRESTQLTHKTSTTGIGLSADDTSQISRNELFSFDRLIPVAIA